MLVVSYRRGTDVKIVVTLMMSHCIFSNLYHYTCARMFSRYPRLHGAHHDKIIGKALKRKHERKHEKHINQ
ncbi:Uncharacterized protein HZ326_3529 [Fusarium oxysporum f. sp. albedinis]|nr:Uncharacterized protein HZ326_3529 [Fusarium oxysporum f. sp. albedinis]